MSIKFVSAKRISEHSVEVTYTLNNNEFSVEWNNIHPGNGKVVDYDLQLETKSDDTDLSKRIDDAIRAGEDDDNQDLEIYLFIRDTFDKLDCESEGFTLSDFDVQYIDEVEGTYIVKVTVGSSFFIVNCQHGITPSYKVSKYVSCNNESGGDYTDSGLAAFVEENCPWLSGGQIEEIIEDCAQPHSEQTVEEYLESLTSLAVTLNSKDAVFGACFAHNCSFSRYDEVDGNRIVIVAEDQDENTPEHMVGEDFIIFENKHEYKDWYNLHQEDDSFRSISAAHRAYQSMKKLK